MKRLFGAILSSLVVLSLVAGCGSAKPAATQNAAPAPAPAQSQQTQSKTPTIDRIKKDGKLVIGTSPDYPPFESLDKQNNPIGFDLDIMQAVADKLGVKLDVVQMGFDNLIAALQAKKFDIMAAGVSVTDDRKKVVDFSNPYLIGKDGLVANSDFNGTVSKLEDLKGKTVAVQIGTVQADNAKKIQGITVKEYNLYTEAAAAVVAKQADVIYVNSIVGQAFIKANAGKLKMIGEIPAADTAYALRKDTPDLTDVVNQTLDDLKKSGQFDALIAKWFK